MNLKKVKSKLLNELTGIREELTEFDSRDFSKRHYDQIIIRNALGYYIMLASLPTLLLIYVLITIALSKSSLLSLIEKNWSLGILLGPLLIALIVYSIRQMFSRRPQIIVNELGIEIEGEQLLWSEIIETKFRTLTNEAKLFVVKTSTREVAIGMDGLNVGPRFLGHHIEVLKRQYGKKHEAQQNV